MAGTVNKVIILGRLGRDPEIKTTNQGLKFANMSVATSETWRDKNTQERKEKTEWHRVVCFNDKLAEIIEKYVHKGSMIYIEGQLTTRKWTDQAGVEKYSTEIVMPKFGGQLTLLDKPPGESGGSTGAPAGGQKVDDEIPY